MSLIVALMFVYVLESIDAGAVLGRTVAFGFETEAECQVKLLEALQRNVGQVEGIQYRGVCLEMEDVKPDVDNQDYDA